MILFAITGEGARIREMAFGACAMRPTVVGIASSLLKVSNKFSLNLVNVHVL
jgi:hypothetical protein